MVKAPARPASRRDLIIFFVATLLVVVGVNGTTAIVSAHNTQAQRDHDRKVDQRQRAADARNAANIAAAVSAAGIRLAKQLNAESDFKTCVSGNKVRAQVVGYIDGVGARAKASAAASRAPGSTSTTLMKQTVIRNLVGTLIAQAQIHAALKPETCIPPPKETP